MRKKAFKSINNGNQIVLFPSNLSDRIPKDHPARLVDRIIDSIDISAIIEGYKGGGTSSYSPRMMLKVIIYGVIDIFQVFLQNYVHNGHFSGCFFKQVISS